MSCQGARVSLYISVLGRCQSDGGVLKFVVYKLQPHAEAHINNDFGAVWPRKNKTVSATDIDYTCIVHFQKQDNNYAAITMLLHGVVVCQCSCLAASVQYILLQ